MKSSIAWIRHPAGHRLGIMARPRAGEWLEDEIAAWRADGVDHVFCLLEREENSDLGLEAEETLCSARGLGFHSFPIPDRGIPCVLNEARAVAERIFELGQARKSVAIHCRAGIGRAALVAGAALVRAVWRPAQRLRRSPKREILRCRTPTSSARGSSASRS